MAENNSSVQNEQAPVEVVTAESLRAASEYIATKEYVKKEISNAVSTCANITFASTEEILSMFRPKPETEEGEKEPETDPETTGGEA